MPRIGRPPKAERGVQWCVHIPAGLAARWDLLLADPVTGRVYPNQKQSVIVPLLQRLWEALSTDSTTIEVGDLLSALNNKLNPLEDL